MTRSNRQTLWPDHSRSGRRAAIAMMALGLAVSVTACGTPETVDPPQSDGAGTTAPATPEDTGAAPAPQESTAVVSALAVADLANVDGEALGKVTFTEENGSLQVSVTTEGMEPGFYGLHVHAIGECEADSATPDDPSDTGAFKSAGGHIPGQDDAKHPNHAGDLPTLLVGQDGTATMSVSTDRLDESLLLDADGAAVMIHSKPDNFANIPERYAAEGPDEDTTNAGDAGERLACGVVES